MGFFKPRNAEERVKHRRGILRLLGFVTVLGMAVFGVRVHVAKAEIGKKTILFGREMVDLSNSKENEVQRIILNGQSMYTLNATTKDDPATILARYEQYCDQNRAQSTEAWRQLGTAQEKAHKVADDSAAAAMGQSGGTYKTGDPSKEGVILCFVRSDKSKATFQEAFKTFAATGELGNLGMIRYAYVRKLKSGTGSHVLAAWSNETFNVKKLAPEGEKDVEGRDFDNVPRPMDSQRIMAASLEGTPFGVNVYQSNASVEDTIGRMDETMKHDGWLVLDIDRQAYERSEALRTASTRLYEKDGAVLTVVSKPNTQTKMTVTSLGMAGANAKAEPPPGALTSD